VTHRASRRQAEANTLLIRSEEKGRNFLEPGDWVLLFTDGIEEAANNAGVEFGVPGLAGVLQANLGRPAGEVRDELLAEVARVARFADGASFADDVCLVAAELPAQTP
jgi:sigma-B regulation protein RsbU (phosphoserine phosphatase)